MKQPQGTPPGIWSLYRMGGLKPAIRSVVDPQTAQQMAFIRQVMKRQRNMAALETPLTELEAVVFDLETTGFSPGAGDEIISIGAVAVTGERIHEEERFYTVVNPGRTIPSHIVELTGIDAASAADAPAVMQGLQMFFAFVNKRMLIAHAAGHDRAFLNAALWKTSRTRLAHRVLDTMMIAKWLEPERSDYTLDAMLGDQGITVKNRHHAMEDSIATAQLWVAFLQRIRQRNIITLGDLYAYLSSV
jgi:DNA polymerase III subunit epsilon